MIVAAPGRARRRTGDVRHDDAVVFNLVLVGRLALATLHGVTTAAAILSAAVIGASAGEGLPLVAIGATAFVLLALELRYIPILRILDASRYSARFRSDDEPKPGPDAAV